MEANFQPRMKRKDFEHFNDDVSDFIFSSPATKIRRLDAELPPMMIVEEEPEVAASTFDQSQQLLPEMSSKVSGGLKIEELPDLGENERAIVLYQPSTPIVRSPSNFSVSLDPRFISALKMLRSSSANSWRLYSDDEGATEDDIEIPSSGNGCQAIVPWLPQPANGDNSCHQFDGGEMMEAEDTAEATSMDVEDSPSIQQSNSGSVPVSQGLPQWQQHCTISQPAQNTTTPIVWYR
ncbi:uncharacterized protein LOC121797942 isoform X2 [Salvia splendens]|uniref:uncharacterized protein LOC121797942 isoform X2 n=1 Tax=Salvia splendens TaxID=180675 RepID=UPI001C27869C|nr:uncharacterized protein LOC121797942 isoform X2 [Salvia splendens]